MAKLMMLKSDEEEVCGAAYCVPGHSQHQGVEFTLRSSDKFFATETGNDPLDVPGFDLEGVCEADVASGTVLIAGLSPRPNPAPE